MVSEAGPVNCRGLADVLPRGPPLPRADPASLRLLKALALLPARPPSFGFLFSLRTVAQLSHSFLVLPTLPLLGINQLNIQVVLG
jgi:hypothetical protein